VSEALTVAVTRGVRASLVAQGLKLALQIGSVSILARLLDPDAYGLVAMAALVIGVAELFRDAGLANAALRAPDLTIHQRDNLFWINTSIGCVLATAFAALAPVVAAGFGHDELTGICLGLAPTFVWSGMATQYRVGLLRDLRVQTLAVCEVAGMLAALTVAVVGAGAGLGYWALVLQQSLGGLLGLVVMVVSAGWLPGRFRRGSGTVPILRLGGRFLGASLMAYVQSNLDSILIGRLLGPASLGLYNRCIQLIRVPLRQVQAPYASVALPVLSRLQHDPRRFVGFVERLQLISAYPVLLGAAVVVAGRRDVVDLALGPRWTAAADVLGWVAAGNAMAAAGAAAGSIYVAMGLGRELQRFSSVNVVIVVICLVVGTAGGLPGIAAGYAAGVTLSWPLTLFFLARTTGLDLTPLARSGLRAVVVAAVAGMVGAGVGMMLGRLPALVSLATIASTVALVAGLAGAVPSIRADYRELAATAARVLRG